MIIKLADNTSLEHVENVWYFCRAGKQIRALGKVEDDFVSAAWAAGSEAASAGYRISIGVLNDELDDLKRKLPVSQGKSIDDLTVELKRANALLSTQAAVMALQQELLQTMQSNNSATLTALLDKLTK